MDEVKAAAYRADDILDTFRYLALREQAQIAESTMTKLHRYFVQNQSLNHINLSRELKSVTDLINGLIKEMEHFNLLVSCPAPVATDFLERETWSSPSPSTELFGRTDDKEKIVNLLLAQSDQPGLQILPIVGMAGIGKTALANEVFNDQRINGHFNLQLWFFVPENADCCGLIALMIELITHKKSESESMEVLKEELIDAISSRRFLLVMDDVSNTHHWDDKVKDILGWAAGPGSCVLVTTQSYQVASTMGTLGTHQLQFLNEDDAWQVFSQKAFSKDVPPQIQEQMVRYGKGIVEQCQGLPLALKVVSALMSKRNLVSEWKSTAESDIFKCTESGNKVLPILKLSWDQLPSESKICFAFLAYFPKGSQIDKESLIQIWSALGYLRKDMEMGVEEKGEKIFAELVSRCFLQVVETTETDFRYSDQAYQLVKCIMHDLIHDLARSLNDECFKGEELVQLQGGDSTRFGCHVMISHCNSLSHIQELGEILDGMDLIRTLCIPSTQPLFTYIGKGPKKLGLKSLRVLQTQYLPNIHRQLEYLFHLRYLDLSYSQLVTLPNSICQLYHLETLKLNHCRWLKSLPEGVGAMRQLQHLYLMDCEELKCMPRNLGMLVNLRTLTTFVVDAEQGRGIDELKNLQLLKNRLEIRGLRNINNISRARDANLYGKDRITDLVLSWGDTDEEESLGHEECLKHEDILQSLAPHSRLFCLSVEGYGGRRVPSWMQDSQNFHCLKKLIISECPNCVDLPDVWLSGTLEHLEVSDMLNLTTLCRNYCSSSLFLFPSLKTLKLSHLPKFTRWAETTSVVTFPNLEALCICYCEEITSFPKCPVLKKIDVAMCNQLHLLAFKYASTLSYIKYTSSLNLAEGYCNCFPLDSWPAPHRLDLNSLAHLSEETLPLPETSERTTYLQTLRVLRLFACGCFSTNQKIGLWDYFGCVEVLEIDGCSDLFTWPREIEKLKRLKVLRVLSCWELKGNGSAGKGILVFPPSLERLYVSVCLKLVELPDLPESLQELTISGCRKLKVVPSGPGRSPSLPKLRQLTLYNCTGLEELPSGELSSLQILTICGCPKVKQLPLGILAQMHGKPLEHLVIKSCPVLQASCSSSGPYFKLVSSVPFKDVEASNGQRTRKWGCLVCPGAAI